MKHFVLFLCAVLMLLPLSVCAAKDEAPSVPDDIMQYAREVALPEFKSFMKASDYVGVIFDTAEEIDSLAITEAIPYYHKEGDDLSKDSIALDEDSWKFVASSDKGHSVLFGVSKRDGVLGYSGAQNAKNYLDAKKIMEKLMKKAGVEGEPLFVDCFYNHVMYADFNGDERVITVLTDAFPLDEAYYSVNDYRELPTLEELNAALAERRAQPKQDENGNYLFGTGTFSLSPKLSEEYAKKTSPWVFVIPAAAAAAACAAGFIFGRRKKTEQ